MNATHAPTPADLVFPPQVPFSWTLRSAARARRSEAPTTERRTYRITGSARSAEELSRAMAFCRAQGARLDLD